MKNFIAFRFTDNDFHEPLRKAVNYVADNRSEDLTLPAWKEFVLRAMVAFHELRRIDMFSYNNTRRDTNFNSRKYFEEWLTVYEVDHLEELRSFDGYVFDTHTFAVFYHAY